MKDVHWAVNLAWLTVSSLSLKQNTYIVIMIHMKSCLFSQNPLFQWWCKHEPCLFSKNPSFDWNEFLCQCLCGCVWWRYQCDVIFLFIRLNKLNGTTLLYWHRLLARSNKYIGYVRSLKFTLRKKTITKVTAMSRPGLIDREQLCRAMDTGEETEYSQKTNCKKTITVMFN